MLNKQGKEANGKSLILYLKKKKNQSRTNVNVKTGFPEVNTIKTFTLYNYLYPKILFIVCLPFVFHAGA